MIETFELKFSNMELLGFAILALLLFLVLKALEKGLPYILKQPEKKQILIKYFTIIEIFIWIGFVIFGIQKLSDSNQIYAFALFVMLMIAFVWLLWYFARNYLSGGMFKFNGEFEINDTIQINEYQGKIIGMGSSRLELESESGEVIYIPYNQLSDAVIVKLHPGEMILSHSFTLATANNGKINQMQESIRFEILSLPWSSLKKTPHIKLIHEDKSQLVFEIVVFTLEKEYFFKIEQELRNKFEANN